MLIAMKQYQSIPEPDKSFANKLRYIKQFIDHNDMQILHVKRSISADQTRSKYRSKVSELYLYSKPKNVKFKPKYFIPEVKCEETLYYVTPIIKEILKSERSYGCRPHYETDDKEKSFVTPLIKQLLKRKQDGMIDKQTLSTNVEHSKFSQLFTKTDLLRKNHHHKTQSENKNQDKSIKDQKHVNKDRSSKLPEENTKVENGPKVKLLNVVVKFGGTSPDTSQELLKSKISNPNDHSTLIDDQFYSDPLSQRSNRGSIGMKKWSDSVEIPTRLTQLAELQSDKARSINTNERLSMEKSPKQSLNNERHSRKFSLLGMGPHLMSGADKSSIDKLTLNSSPMKLSALLSKSFAMRSEQSKNSLYSESSKRSNRDSHSYYEDGRKRSKKTSLAIHTLLHSLAGSHQTRKANIARIIRQSQGLSNTFKSSDIADMDSLSEMSEFEAEEPETRMSLKYTNNIINRSKLTKLRNASGNFMPMKLKGLKDEYQSFSGVDGLSNSELVNSSIQNMRLTSRESVIALSHMFGLKKLLNLEEKIISSSEESAAVVDNTDIEAIYHELMSVQLDLNEESEIEDGSF